MNHHLLATQLSSVKYTKTLYACSQPWPMSNIMFDKFRWSYRVTNGELFIALKCPVPYSDQVNGLER